MENNNSNNKQQNFSSRTYTKNSQTADSKRKTDLQASKCAFPRAARRRDQQPTTRSELQQRNSKQQQQQQAAKLQRPYVEKRPRARGSGVNGASYHAARNEDTINAASSGSGSSNNNNDRTNDSLFAAGAGLVDGNCIDEIGYDDYDFDEDDDDDHVDVDELHHHNYKGRESRVYGSKRKNLNHLLNFRYVFRERADDFLGGNGGIAKKGASKAGGYGGVGVKQRHQQSHKYNKEQFLQANFQFVIKSNVKPHLITSPDSCVDWSLIEQINIQTTEEPQCPICLYPPVAAKLTRCGHAYCWPCILHYLALNDKSWRKCPICYEAVHVNDLKSTAILQQQPLNVGDSITFQLMRRKKGSFFVEKFKAAAAAPTTTTTTAVERYPLYAGNSDMKAFSKFLLAKRSDIVSIIERERAELLADDDTTCPEYVFVQQALNLLNERREKLGEIMQQAANNTDADDVDEEEEDEELNDVADIGEDKTAAINHDEQEVDIQAASVDGSNADSMLLQQQQQKFYYFYQSIDGQNIFLHPLNVKMLQACFGALEFAPLNIVARIIQKECHTMDENLRRKFTCLGHLPLTCQFSIVEVDLKAPIIDAQTLKLFKDDIRQRQQDRERRDREERKRERKIAAINDRQMGKLTSELANINLSSTQEFPACGFGFELVSPTISAYSSTSPSKSSAELATNRTADKAKAENNFTGPSSPPPQPAGPSYSSIITSRENSAMNNIGLFPELSLKAAKHTAKLQNKSGNSGGPNGQNRLPTATPQVNVEMLESDFGDTPKRIGTTFGDVMEQAIARRTIEAIPPTPSSSSNTITMAGNASASGGGGGGGAVNNGKKQKRDKKKMVPLFSNNAGGGKYNFN